MRPETGDLLQVRVIAWCPDLGYIVALISSEPQVSEVRPGPRVAADAPHGRWLPLDMRGLLEHRARAYVPATALPGTS